MSAETRYVIERVKDRLWVVIDKAREGRHIGRASDETGAHKIASLIRVLRTHLVEIAVSGRSQAERGGALRSF